MNSLIPGADILEDFHFIPDSKSTTLVYKFGSSTEHSPYDEGLTTMGAGTTIYYFTATGTLGTIYAFAAGDQKAFLKKYNNGTWSNWVALVSNADFIYQTFEQASIAVPANGDITVEFNISKSGYKALGIVGFASSNPTAIVSRAQMVFSENKATVTLKNTASSQTNTLARIQVLYISG